MGQAMIRGTAFAATVALFVATPALAHSWYSDRQDPVYRNSCCGGNDCSVWQIEPGSLTAEAAGYRVRLTLEQAMKINPYATSAIDALVIWERVQASEDGNWNLCVQAVPGPRFFGIYCLFAPPNT